jgi:hypothetical protein
MRARPMLCLLLAACACGAAAAGDIYRWVDENGKAHLSDRPPPNPPKNMTRQDSKDFDISTQRQREAAERAAKEKARLRAMEVDRTHRERVQAPKPPATAASSARGVAMPAPNASCAARRDAFRRSSECFGPYRTVTGINPEAFAACGQPVPDPSTECGTE